MIIKASKFYKSRAGFKVKVYAIGCGGSKLHIHGAIEYPDGTWRGPLRFNDEGRHMPQTAIEISKNDDYDIVAEWSEVQDSNPNSDVEKAFTKFVSFQKLCSPQDFYSQHWPIFEEAMAELRRAKNLWRFKNEN